MATTLHEVPHPEVTSLDLSNNMLLGTAGVAALGHAIGGGALASLASLNLAQSNTLTLLPQELGLLTQLRTLNLRNCHALRCLPRELAGLGALQTLTLSGCRALGGMPDLSPQLQIVGLPHQLKAWDAGGRRSEAAAAAEPVAAEYGSALGGGRSESKAAGEDVRRRSQ